MSVPASGGAVEKRVAHSGPLLEVLLDLCDNILGRSFCALGDGATSPITSSIQYFRDEYLALIGAGAAGDRVLAGAH